MRRLILPAMLMAAALVGGGCRHGSEPVVEASVRPGVNARYFEERDPEAWKARFEVESREIFDRRDDIVDAVELRPGMAVADIGAGTGFLSLAFAREVGPEGRVFAVDILPEFTDYVFERATAAGLTNVTPVVCDEDDVLLPPGSVDLVFVCDTYHHFEYPSSTLASIRRALRPGGELVVIDFEKIEGKSRRWVIEHVRAGEEQVTQEIEAAGFRRIQRWMFLRENWFARFVREPS